jgi:hypothetical protein
VAEAGVPAEDLARLDDDSAASLLSSPPISALALGIAARRREARGSVRLLVAADRNWSGKLAGTVARICLVQTLGTPALPLRRLSYPVQAPRERAFTE